MPPPLFHSSFTTRRSPSQFRPWVSQSTTRSIPKSTTSTSIEKFTLRLPPCLTPCPPRCPSQSRSHTMATTNSLGSSTTLLSMVLHRRASSLVAAFLKRARTASSERSSVVAGVPVNDVLIERFGASTGRGKYAVRRRREERRGMLLCSGFHPLLLRLVSFGFLSWVLANILCWVLRFLCLSAAATRYRTGDRHTVCSLYHRTSPRTSTRTHTLPRASSHAARA